MQTSMKICFKLERCADGNSSADRRNVMNGSRLMFWIGCVSNTHIARVLGVGVETPPWMLMRLFTRLLHVSTFPFPGNRNFISWLSLREFAKRHLKSIFRNFFTVRFFNFPLRILFSRNLVLLRIIWVFLGYDLGGCLMKFALNLISRYQSPILPSFL